MPSTWKLWWGRAPLGMASTSAGQDRPARRRKRSSSDPASRAGPTRSSNRPPSQPVGLDDLSVQRVVEVVGRGDELQVRPGTLKLPQPLAKVPIHNAGRRLLEQGPVVLATAVPQLVGRVGVASEQQGTVSDRTGSREVWPVHVASAPM